MRFIPKWLKKFVRSLENPSTPLNTPLGGNPTLAGVTVNEQSAMRYSTVWACVNRLSADIASLKFSVYQHLPQGGKAPAADNRIDRLIRHSPDGIRPAYKFWQTAASHVLRWGNGYCWIERTVGGQVLRLHLLPPDKVLPEFRNNRLIYRLYGVELPGCRSIIQPFNMLHFAGMGYDGIIGYSPIRMAAESIGLGISADLTMSSFYGLSTKPAGYLQHPGQLSEQAKKTLREEWELLHAGPTNAGRPAILQEGMSWNPSSMPAPDQAFLQSRQWQPEEICRWYLMPPTKAGIYDHATYSNLEQSTLDYLSTLVPWANSFCGEMHHKLFDGADRERYFIRPNYNELKKPDTAAMNSWAATGRQWGYLNVDEIRDELDLNPLENGEGKIYLSPSNMVTGQQVLKQQDEPPPEATQAKGPTDTPPSVTPATASRAVVVEEVKRLLRREVASVCRAAKKPDFKGFISQFKDEFADTIRTQLDPSLIAYRSVSGSTATIEAVAAKWCDQTAEILRGVEEVCTADQLPKAVEDLTTTWEAQRSEEILSHLNT